MESLYFPASSLFAGKRYSPLSSVTTEIVLVDPSFLALTSTPSMTGSCAEVTLPDNAAPTCAWACRLPHDTATPMTKDSLMNCMRPPQEPADRVTRTLAAILL